MNMQMSDDDLENDGNMDNKQNNHEIDVNLPLPDDIVLTENPMMKSGTRRSNSTYQTQNIAKH